MADQVLRLIVTGDSKQATKAMRALQKDMKKSGEALSKFGTAGLVAGGAVLAGLMFTVKAAGEAKQAHVKLENTLRNMPKLARANIAVFDAQAKSISRLTAVEDDEVTAAQAMLGTFQITESQMLGMMPLIADYARKFGVDMPTAAKQVGKAMDGQIGALKKNGVSLDENMYKTDRYRAISEALRNQVGGFAKDEMVAFPAQLQATKNALMDLAETIGGPASASMSDMLGQVRDIVYRVTDWVEKNPELTAQMIETTTKAAVATVAIAGLSKVVGVTMIAFGKWLPVLVKTAKWLGAGGIAAAAAQVGAALQLMVYGSSFSAIAALGTAAAATTVAVTGLAVALGVGLGVAAGNALTHIRPLMDALTKLMDDVQDAGGKTQEWYDREAQAKYGVTDAERKKIVATREGKAAQDSANGATNAATAATKELVRAMNGQMVAADSLAGKTRTLAEADLANRSAVLDLKDARKNLTDAIKQNGKHSEEAARAQIGVEQAEMRAKDAFVDYTTALNANGGKTVAEIAKLEAAWQRAADAAGRAASKAHAALNQKFGSDSTHRHAGPAQFASGGWSSGPSTGYAATLHGTEAVISFDQRYRAANVALINQAASRLGIGGNTTNVNVYGSRSDASWIATQVRLALAGSSSLATL